MAVLFDWECSRRPQRGCIGSVKSFGAKGVYLPNTFDGPWVPDRNALAAAVPHQWRKAVFRASLWWYHHNDRHWDCYLELNDRRGFLITNIMLKARIV